MTIPAVAMVTRNLGFGVTCTLSYEHPYPFARRMSTLDHLTQGRIGWNIVTGYLNSAAKGMGMPQQTGHDTRYDIADDYMEVCYKLWEGSWEDGAVLRDRASAASPIPPASTASSMTGRTFRLSAIHLCEPSPQRTPVLFQAGASGRGRAFAARHAECVFINGPSKQVIAPIVADLRRRTAEAGRDPAELVIFLMMTVITDTTTQRAHDKLADYRRYASEQGGLVLMSGWTGVDFAQLDPAEIVRFDQNDAMTSALEAFTTADPSRTWTVREIAAHAAIGGRSPLVVGSPPKSPISSSPGWRTDVDGFNLAYAVTPEPSPTSSTSWCPSCKAAALTNVITRPVPFARNCTAKAEAACPRPIPPPATEGPPHER